MEFWLIKEDFDKIDLPQCMCWIDNIIVSVKTENETKYILIEYVGNGVNEVDYNLFHSFNDREYIELEVNSGYTKIHIVDTEIVLNLTKLS